MKPSILFWGTPQFALTALKALFDAGYPILGVVSQPDKPVGRGQKLASPPCAEFAKKKNIPLFQPTSLKAADQLKPILNLKPDFSMVCAYGHILPKSVLEQPKTTILNIHASLLPEFRGASPIQASILSGKKETGVSLMGVIQKMDAGPVYAQKKISITETDTAETLSEKLSQLGAEIVLENLPAIFSGNLKSQEQDESKVSLCPKIQKEQGLMAWNETALNLSLKVRAFNPWPVAYTFIDGKRLKIYDATPLNEKPKIEPGTIYLICEAGIYVACKDSALCLTEVQLEGKKRMSAADFARGIRLEVGTKL